MDDSQRAWNQSDKGKAAKKRWYNHNKKRIIPAQREYMRTPIGRYLAHKSRAKYRGIGWCFTFESWWKIWEPHWNNRGQGSDDLQMCRNGDTGPYGPYNVRIDTCANNVRESQKLRKEK